MCLFSKVSSWYLEVRTRFPFPCTSWSLVRNNAMVGNGDALGTSLVVQWLRLCTFNAGSSGSISGWRTKIPHAMGCSKEKGIPHSTTSIYCTRMEMRGTRQLSLSDVGKVFLFAPLRIPHISRPASQRHLINACIWNNQPISKKFFKYLHMLNSELQMVWFLSSSKSNAKAKIWTMNGIWS